MDKQKADDESKPSKDRIIEWTSRAWAQINQNQVLSSWKVYRDYHEMLKNIKIRKLNSFLFFSHIFSFDKGANA